MKAQIRKIVRSAAGLPGVGRLVRIGVAVIRLPETRDAQRQFDAELVQQMLRGSGQGDAAFQNEQLPSLLQSLSDLNQRQIANDHDQLNLVKSVPMALRKLTREMVELQGQARSLAAGFDERLGGVTLAADAKIDAANAQLEAMRASHGQLDQVVRDLAANPEAAQFRLHTEQRLGEIDQRQRNLAESISYLLGRVEFVRREVMFEMRYGASAPTDEKEQLKATTEIIEVEKVEAARASGLRLNLGCGHIPLEGYLNVDRRPLPGVDIVAEVDALPFGKNELSEICSAHLLEHFPEEQLRRELLPYWVSLLKEDGVFRAIVPDGKGMTEAFVSSEYTFDTLRKVTFGGQDYDGDFHFNMFSPDSLTEILKEAGLSQVDVIAENRENGGCKEFEIVARR